MTISTEVRKAGPFIGNGSASVFPFAFKVFKAADLIVVRRQDNIGEETTLVLDSDYHVTLNSNQDTTPGGVVTLVAGALASGFTLVVSSELPYLQPTDLTNQGGFYPKVITNALDRLTIFCQQLAEITGRTLKLPITAPTNISAEIPLPNPSELIAWDETGTGLTTVSPQSLVTSIAYGSATADLFAGDGVTTTFPLSTNPASVNNLDVSVGGFSKRPVQGGIGDYSWNGGASITFAEPPPAPSIPGDKNVLVRYMQAIPVSDSEALHAQTREALRRSYAEAGYTLVEGSFETGGTLTSTADVLLLESAGTAYAWTGAYPGGGYDVAPGIDPTVVPGFALRKNVVLRSELGEKPLVMSYVLTTIPDHSDAYEYALNSGRTVIVDVPLTLTRAVIKSENEPVSVRVTNGAKISPPDFAPRLRSNPEHRLTHDAERKFYTLNPANIRHETMVSYDGVVVNRNTSDHRNLVTAYFGADSQNSPNARIWAINTVTNVHKGALFASEAYGYELDVNVDADNTGSNGPVEGLRVAGVGSFDGWQNAFAVHIMRDGSGNYKWNCGVKMREIVDAFQIYYPSRYLMLAYTDKPIKLVPTVQNGNPLFQINNPTDTATVYSVDDRGKGTFAGGANIGGGTTVSQIRSYRSTGVGFGDIAAGASVTKTFTDLFGATMHTFTSCDVNITVDKSGGAPAGLVFTNYTDTATGVHYIRVTNITAATILNTAFGIRATVTQF